MIYDLNIDYYQTTKVFYVVESWNRDMGTDKAESKKLNQLTNRL